MLVYKRNCFKFPSVKSCVKYDPFKVIILVMKWFLCKSPLPFALYVKRNDVKNNCSFYELRMIKIFYQSADDMVIKAGTTTVTGHAENTL